MRANGAEGVFQGEATPVVRHGHDHCGGIRNYGPGRHQRSRGGQGEGTVRLMGPSATRRAFPSPSRTSAFPRLTNSSLRPAKPATGVAGSIPTATALPAPGWLSPPLWPVSCSLFVPLRRRRCPGGRGDGHCALPATLVGTACTLAWLRPARCAGALGLTCDCDAFATVGHAWDAGQACAGCNGHTPTRALWLRSPSGSRLNIKRRNWGAWAVTGAVWIGAVIDASCFNRDKGVYPLRALSLVFRATSPMSANSHLRKFAPTQ